MLFLTFRTINAIFAVVVGVVVSHRFGDSGLAKLLTISITTGVVALFEWLLIWAPKHSMAVRRLLDPRSVFSGVWIQNVKQVQGSEGSRLSFPNRFAVFTISYQKDVDNYAVEGTAYTNLGDEHARWNSTDAVHFTKDGRSMTYLWTGSITNSQLGSDEPSRQGFGNLRLGSENGGRGRVDHVAVAVILQFNVSRITEDWLSQRQLNGFAPENLYDPAVRDQFALEYSKTLHGETALADNPQAELSPYSRANLRQAAALICAWGRARIGSRKPEDRPLHSA